MRGHLIQNVLDRAFADVHPHEDYFVAGPPKRRSPVMKDGERQALLDRLRRQRRLPRAA